MKTFLTLIVLSLLLAGCCGTVPPAPQPTSPIPASKVSPINPLPTLETGTLKEMTAAHLRNMEAMRQLVIDREAVRRMLQSRGLLGGDSGND